MNKRSDLPKKAHFIGICGVATGSVAIAFKEAGIDVTGSDKGFYPPVSTALEEANVKFYAGWHPEKISENGKPDIVVVGTASGSQNPETIYAKENGIPVYSFAKAVGEFIASKNNIVCVGTWGKTSSTAMLAHIMKAAGEDPSYMFGAIPVSGKSAALTDSDIAIFEGDEYKSAPDDPTAKFSYYKATHLLLTAVSWDHADLYPTEESYFDAFNTLLNSLPSGGFVVACADHAGVNKIADKYNGRIIRYGKNAEYSYREVKQSKHGLDFIISHNGINYKIYSPMLGSYQAENITACFAMADQFGIDTDAIITAIGDFGGLKRRMEIRLSDNNPSGVTVIDDIAHSPEKASYVLKDLQKTFQGNVIAIFEPNTGGRRREAIRKYDNAFKDADTVIIPRLTKLKVSDDDNDRPIEGDELSDEISKTHKNVIYIDDDNALIEYLDKNTKKGDVIAFLGSHGFRNMIEEIVKNKKAA
ncbi:MAG: Mur ligase family protein [Patescibacteria group bacterium]|nr:Mur ligase family protein [Patescibacteria group bacterium]